MSSDHLTCPICGDLRTIGAQGILLKTCGGPRCKYELQAQTARAKHASKWDKAPGQCPVCGEARAKGAGHYWMKSCGSRDCISELTARGQRGKGRPRIEGPRDDRGLLRQEKSCVVCGETYLADRGTAGLTRKTCSRGCAAQLKRERSRGKRKGAANPNFKGGHRSGVRDRDGERRWYAGAPQHCENPACEGLHMTLNAHHCFYEQAVRVAKGDRFDPRNRLVLCVGCHMSHHRRTRPLSVAVLPDSVIEFGVELMGPGAAYEYLARRYSGSDARLDALLERNYPQEGCGDGVE